MPELENFSPEQSENITPPQAGSSLLAKLKTKWPVVLGVLGSIVILTTTIYAAYTYSKRDQEIESVSTAISLPEPILTIAPLRTPASITSSPSVCTRKIAFVRDGEIWVISSDGNGGKQITDLGNNAVISDLTFSPSANKIAFTIGHSPAADKKDLGGRLFVLDRNTETLMSITKFNGSLTYANPIWSPKEDKIAVELRTGSEYSTYVVDISGNLLFKADAVSIYPGDGSKQKGSFVFPIGFLNDNESLLIHYEPGRIAPSFREEAILKLKPDHTYQEIITGKFEYVNLSPSGNTILYVKDKKVQNIWTVNSDGSNNRQLTNHPDNFPEMLFYQTNGIPKFSPDENKILATLSSSGTPLDTTGGIVIIDVNTGEEESLLPYFGLRGFNWINNTEIIFSSIRTDGSYIADLWKLNIETLEKQKLTTNASQPDCSPLAICQPSKP